MNILRLKGTYRETGKQYGTMIKGDFAPFQVSEKKRLFSRECEKVTAQYCPGIIDHIEAFAQAAEIDEEFMKCFILTLGLEPSCSVFAVSGDYTVDGLTVFGRNYDWDLSAKDDFTPIKMEPADGLVSISFTDHMIGRYGGVNEEDLAVAITAIPAYQGKPCVGVRMNIATQWILDNFKDTGDAAEWLKEIPHQWAHNFLIADREGLLARVETAPEKTMVAYSEEFIATTNHYLDSEMRKLEDPAFDFSNTHTRYQKLEEWYKRNRNHVNVDTVKTVLRGHGDGVCDHYEDDEIKAGTIWSWISQLGSDIIHVCHGFPCENEYQIVNLR
jgi:predicted choloylglycine hydrolase